MDRVPADTDAAPGPRVRLDVARGPMRCAAGFRIAAAKDPAAATRVEQHHVPIRLLQDPDVASPARAAEVAAHALDAELEPLERVHPLPDDVAWRPDLPPRELDRLANGLFALVAGDACKELLDPDDVRVVEGGVTDAAEL